MATKKEIAADKLRYEELMRQKLVDENRRKYPEIAELVDRVREHFPKAKVTSVRHLTLEEIEARKKYREVRASHGPTVEVDATYQK
jgi:hypothetical protein